ncbi:hypothetical protein JM18_008726 [Phytophthora kernoviae]|uniref:GPI inositol-deacylase n=1 Tax=Phytophthora kernoviae TaxID=325452 RepID=A0A8T0LN31_9STRA|nr:hypothetical protein JM16_008848 [Phytophthora kernoviae]KAG2510717.1 hypothetical protein JM18_008726 [Phytophthora kernoviae]
MTPRVRWIVSVFAIIVFVAASINALPSPEDNVELTLDQRRLQTSLIDAPSVNLHVTLKRKSMKIHGQSEFDVFANPVVSTDKGSVLYNGYATFVEEDTQFKYVLLDAVEPFDSILPALNEATRIPSVSLGGETVECSSGDLFKTSFGGANFALCASGGNGFTAFSSDMTIAVEYLDKPVSISKPQLSDKSASCSTVETATLVTPTAIALLTGKPIPPNTSRNLKTAEHMAMEASTCECKSTPRPCIFFHGIGNKKEKAELQDKPCARMGSIGDHAPCCSTVKYAWLDTIDYSWTNDTIQEKLCGHALSMSESSDLSSATIDDTIIVTHSMGGLVMSAALASGKCRFGPGTSWVAVSSPMTGSMTADYAQDVYNDELGTITVDMLDVIGQCPIAASRRSLLYEGEKYTSEELNTAYVAAQEAYRGNVTAAMCSNNYVGVISVYQWMFILTGKIVHHKYPENDGLVEFQSCAKGLDSSLFGTSYTDQFYIPELNHADTAFMTSDGWFKDSQKPFKWFECLL